jgi:hypothetical protein
VRAVFVCLCAFCTLLVHSKCGYGVARLMDLLSSFRARIVQLVLKAMAVRLFSLLWNAELTEVGLDDFQAFIWLTDKFAVR